MKILVFSSLYPPIFKGGYEIICKDVNDELLKRGHDVRVVTSKYGLKEHGEPLNESNVYRELDIIRFSKIPLYKLIPGYQFEKANINILRNHLKQFRPDVISIWNFSWFSRAQLIYLKQCGIPIVYNILDYWLLRWFYGKSIDRWFWHNKWLKVFLPGITLPDEPPIREWQPLDLDHIWFLSEHVKNEHVKAGLPVEQGPVIYNGISLETYKYDKQKAFPFNQSFRLLYVGRINKDKGVHTVLDAVKGLNKKSPEKYQLTIIGDGPADYINRLKQFAAQNDLQGQIHFTQHVPYQELPRIYAEHDALIFPSIWEEPLGRSWQEAMACGVPVIATSVGGLKEILVDGENSLTFSPDNSEELTFRIECLFENQALYEQIRTSAYEMISKKFTLEIMADQVEECLENAVTRKLKDV